MFNPYVQHTTRAVHCICTGRHGAVCAFHICYHMSTSSKSLVLVLVQVKSLAVPEPTRWTLSQLLRKPYCFAGRSKVITSVAFLSCEMIVNGIMRPS